jgi:MFS family permease
MKQNVKVDEGNTQQETAIKIDKSLRAAIKEGGFFSIMKGFGESYLSAFAVFLKASALQIGLLASIPQLISALLQLFAVKLTNIFKSRKKIVITFVLAQAITWLVILSIFFLTNSVWILIFLTSLYFVFGSILTPAWMSWMGDLVHEEQRGKYFGRRNRVMGFASFISIIVAGYILEQMSVFSTFYAFMILFGIAFLSRLISFYFILTQFEPSVEIRVPKEVGFISFLKDITKSNFGIFSLYVNSMRFAVNLISPLFVIYWLTYLNYTYFQYMILIATTAIAGFITMAYWGAHADYYGNKTVLWVSSYLTALVPLLWYFFRFFDSFTFAITIQAISGFAWAGFNLSSSNFIFDSVKPRERIRLISYHNVNQGIAIFLGATIGGLIAGFSFNSPIMSIILPAGIFLPMLLSFVVRLIVIFLFLHKVNETRIVKHRPHFLYFVAVMPAQGIIFDSVVGMNRTLKRFKQQLLKIESKLTNIEGSYKKRTKND